MANFIYRLLLSFNATSLILVVFLIKEEIVICGLSSWSYLVYFAVPIVLTFVSLKIVNLLSKDSIAGKDNTSLITDVEQANNAFLPSYLGYFFVALSVENHDTLIYVFLILFVFTFMSQTLYFNPLFLLFGYHFYYLKTQENVKIFLISRRKIRKPKNLLFPVLRRINDYTFIETNKKE